MTEPYPNPVGDSVTKGQRLVYENLPKPVGRVAYDDDLDSVHEYKQGTVFEIVVIGDENDRPTLMLKDETGCLITVPRHQTQYLFDPVEWGLYHRREHYAKHREAREANRQFDLLKEILRAQKNLIVTSVQAEQLLNAKSTSP